MELGEIKTERPDWAAAPTHAHRADRQPGSTTAIDATARDNNGGVCALAAREASNTLAS